MNPNPDTQSPNDEALSQFLQAALPVPNTPDALTRRVALLATRTPAKPRVARRNAAPLRLAASAAIVGSLLLLGALFWPQYVGDQFMKRVEAAVARVSSVHMEEFRIENGHRILEGNTWFQDGKWRVERLGDGFANVFDRGNLWNYNARDNTVSLRRGAKSPFSHTPKGFTLSDMMREFQSEGDKATITLQGQAQWKGQTVQRVLLETQNSYETDKIVFLVDSETDLPVFAQASIRTRYGKEGKMEIEFSYNRRFPASLFRPVFGGNPRFVELARQEKSLQARLDHSLASQKVGERTVSIRALEVNSRGAVFALYTAGKRRSDGFRDGENFFPGRDWKVFLSDSLGTRYEWMQNDLSFHDTNQTVKGQRLEGDWWVPTLAPAPHARFAPRTFSLTFELNPHNLHGKMNVHFAPDYSASAVFQIPVSEAENAVVPPLVQGIQPHLTAQDIIQPESEMRGELPPGQSPSPQLAREVDGFGAFSPDSRLVASPEAGGVQLSNLQSGTTVHLLKAGAPITSPAQNIAFSPDGGTLFALFSRGTDASPLFRACLWNTRTGGLSASWDWKSSRDTDLRDLTFSPDGRSLRALNTLVTKRGTKHSREYIAAMNAQVEERDALSGRVLAQRTLPHNGFLIGVLESEPTASDWRAVTSQEPNRPLPGAARVWNAASGKLERQLATPSDFRGVRIGFGGDIVGVSGELLDAEGHGGLRGNVIRLYRASTGEFLNEVRPENGAFAPFLALSPDGTRLSAQTNDHKIGLWEVASGRQLLSLTGHYSGVYQLRFSPDGKWLETGDVKDKVLLWHLP